MPPSNKALDLFCGAGGATKGLQRAGFHVIGVDIEPQPHYCGDGFIQTDALSFDPRRLARSYDFIWASPPCQKFSQLARRWPGRDYPDLIEYTRELLKATGLPYVIENVDGAPLLNPILLCGTMFGLVSSAKRELRRHRLFEAPTLRGILTPPCNHRYPAVGVYGHSGGRELRRKYHTPRSSAAERREVMQIDWMNRDEMSEAVPPAFSEFIGKRVFGG